MEAGDGGVAVADAVWESGGGGGEGWGRGGGEEVEY